MTVTLAEGKAERIKAVRGDRRKQEESKYIRKKRYKKRRDYERMKWRMQ